MATITAQMVMASTAGELLSDALAVSQTATITSTATTGIARRPITSTAKETASGQVTLYTADDFAAISYIYIRNIDGTASDYVYVYDDTTSGDPVILKLAGGDWAFMPTIADKTLKAYAATSGTVVEWIVFGTDQ